MTPFLAAQSADPLDPVPMLVWADHLEEHGDATAAEVLRGLVGAGVPSLVALAGAACLVSVPWEPDGDPLSARQLGKGSGDGFDFIVDRLGSLDEDYNVDDGDGEADGYYSGGYGYAEGHR